MHHYVSSATLSSSLFYSLLTKTRSDICTRLVYFSMHEALIIIFNEANISKPLNRNELSVPPNSIGFHRQLESDGR